MPLRRSLRLLPLFGLGLLALAAAALVAPRHSAAATAEPIVVRLHPPAFVWDGDQVRLPGYAAHNAPGAPALPVAYELIELPADGRPYHLNVQVGAASLHAAPYPLRPNPAPAPPPRDGRSWTSQAELPAVPPTVIAPDPAVYEADAFYPEQPVVVVGEQWQRGRRLLTLAIFPLQYHPLRQELRAYGEIVVRVEPDAGAAPQATTAPHTAPVWTPDGPALRIETAERGLYRLTFAELQTAGFPVETVDPAQLALHYLGQPVALEWRGNGDAVFDPDELLVFYAEPYTGRYQTRNVYWLTVGDAPGLRMGTRAVTPEGGEPTLTVITRTLTVERNLDYRSDLPRPRDADHWYDLPLSVDVLGAATATRTYDLPTVAPLAAGDVQIEALFYGLDDRPINPDKSVALRLNGRDLGPFQWDGRTEHRVVVNAPAAWLDGAPNRIELRTALAQLPGIDFYGVAPDWVRLTYPSAPAAQNDRLWIAGLPTDAAPPDAVYAVQATGFTTETVAVYDVRDPRQPVRLTTTVAAPQRAPASATYAVAFWDVYQPAAAYMLSASAALRAPAALTLAAPSPWAAAGQTADYIAVVHRALWDAIDPLLAHRAAEGLRIAKVDVQELYDAWAFGRRDPEAIRSFLAHAYQTWNPGEEPPGYVLLVGDGHYDFTGVSGTTLPNLIPPYLVDVDPWIGEVPADNRYVSIDGPDDYLPEMAIGRIPANTPADVTAAVDKIIAYETTAPAGYWQKRVVFVADNHLDPAGNFHAFSDDVRLNWLPPLYDGQMIYYNRDYTTAAAMRTAIRGAFDADALLIQWFGHGSRFRWGSVSMFNIFDVPALAANDTWPFTQSYSCWSGYFVNLISNWQSLGELLLITPQRGSVADLSPGGLHIGESLLVLNRGLVQAALQQRIARVGDAADAARLYYFAQSGSFHDTIDTTILFGDPALTLRLPPTPTSVTLRGAEARLAEATPLRLLWLFTAVALGSAIAVRRARRRTPHPTGDFWRTWRKS